MGYLDLANDMADNVTKVLSDVVDSKIATYLQGNGTPVLVTYYNMDEALTTSELGNYTVDQLLGENSPIRYNRIENLPIVGLKELIPSIDILDGNLMDLTIEGDVILFPNTVKPTPLDLFVYRYLNGCSITFRVNGFEFSSIKSQDFYKINIGLKDLNDMDTIDKAEAQVVKGYVAKVDNIGSQDKCIIEDKIYAEITDIERAIEYLVDLYKDYFYNVKYNCIMLRDSPFGGYTIYDPYLTTFISKNDLLDTDRKFPVISNFDYRPEIESGYRRSIWKVLETRNTAQLKMMIMEPVSFRTVDTNPFTYYGEEIAFTIDLKILVIEGSTLNVPNLYCDRELIASILYREDNKKLNLIARPRPDTMIDIMKEPLLKPNVDETDVLPKFTNIQKHIEDLYTEDIKSDDTGLENKVDRFEPPREEDALLFPTYLNYIRDYITNESLYGLFTPENIKEINMMDLQYNVRDFIHIPMLIFVLKRYMTYLNNRG